MKKLFLLFLILCSFSLYGGNRKVKKSDVIASAVATKMLEKNLVIYVSNVVSDMGKQVFSSGLRVTLIKDVFTCNLPYMGVSNVATYGSQDLYVTAENIPVNVTSEFIEKKKYYDVKFQFTSKFDNELFDVQMKVYTNGKVSMTLTSTRRSAVKYIGGLFIHI